MHFIMSSGQGVSNFDQTWDLSSVFIFRLSPHGGKVLKCEGPPEQYGPYRKQNRLAVFCGGIFLLIISSSL
jgi:hypothetical protein